MKNKRNTDKMIRANISKRKEMFILVNKTIDKFHQDKKTINFSIISKQCGVSRAYLYRNKEIKKKIEKYRSSNVKSHNISDKSKDTIIKALEKENKKLINELEKAKSDIKALEIELNKYKYLVFEG